MTTLLDPDSVGPWLAKYFRGCAARGLVAGIDDDDCAVMRWHHSLLVVTTDFLNATPIAIQLGIATYRALGELIVASNISDLCGTGARPQALLIGAMFRRCTPVTQFREFMSGVRRACQKWKTQLIGGDTKLGERDAFFGVAIGSAPSRRSLFLKNSARAGDLIWVSGHVGDCAAATVVLGGDMKDICPRGPLIQTITSPRLPLEKSKAVSSLMLGRGGIDISDGLRVSLARMASASDVGAKIALDQIPVSPAVTKISRALQVPPWSFAFASGGDFQFLVTTSSRAKTQMRRLGFFEIGSVTDSRVLRFTETGKKVALPEIGHEDRRSTDFCSEIRTIVEELKQC
ncbi:hypothetical protein B7486_08010 [cyanobacterium TDX16]|nr:hypothetical protein B7486_08010 [cyanobacterium TDX16]